MKNERRKTRIMAMQSAVTMWLPTRMQDETPQDTDIKNNCHFEGTCRIERAYQ